MSQVWAVYKRELKLYFRSPIAYAVAFALMLLFGLLFSSGISEGNNQLPADTLNYIPNVLTFLLFLVAPLLTMRLLAEEAREGTLETLMTLPIKESQFIVGKFLAVWTYYTLILLLTLVYHFILTRIGVPDNGRALGMYVGAWLYGGAVLAVSMIWSALTEDQIIAAFLAAAAVLVLYLADTAATWAAGQAATQVIVDFVRELSLTTHYNNTLANGIVRAEDIVYFIFLMVAALFITTRIVETRRWRA